jgi:hypothetical protein
MVLCRKKDHSKALFEQVKKKFDFTTNSHHATKKMISIFGSKTLLDNYECEEFENPPNFKTMEEVEAYVDGWSAVHIVVGPCAKGHFIHAGSPDLEFFFFFFLMDGRC